MDITPRVTGSTLFNHAKTNPMVAKALSAVDGVDQTSRLMAGLVNEAKALTLTTPRADVDAAILDSLAAGEGIPADTVARYGGADAAERAWVLAEGALRDLYSTLLRQRDELVEGGLDTMCQTLDAELKRTITGMRKLLPAPATAEEAIAEGKTTVYKKVSDLRAEYFQIRAAHRALLSGGLGSDDAAFQHLSKGWPIVAHAASLGAVWPKLPEFYKYGREQVAGGRLVKLTPPWPDPDSEAFLDWLLAHPDANPWVPSFDQAADLLNQIVKAAPTYYQTTRSPDQEAQAREYERRQRMWGSASPAHIAGSERTSVA